MKAGDERQSGLRDPKSKHVPLVVLRCKVLLVGDACVGKTAFSQVFHSGGATFPKNYLMTVGAEFLSKQVPVPDTNALVELYMFDCAGQSIFNQVEMNAKYVRPTPTVTHCSNFSSAPPTFFSFVCTPSHAPPTPRAPLTFSSSTRAPLP